MLPTHLQLMRHPSTCIDEWHQSSLQKGAGGKSQLCSNGPSPENFLTIDGYFECNTFSRHGPSLAEEERKTEKMKSSELRPFQVGHLRTVSMHAL